MFVRIKSTPNSFRKSVQIVSSVGDGSKFRQKIVRHVGIVMDDEELLQASRYRASHHALRRCVRARIANLGSKRCSVWWLEQDLGLNLPLEKVYRMMDQTSWTMDQTSWTMDQTSWTMGGLWHQSNGYRYAIPFNICPEAEKSYQILGLRRSGRPHRLS